MCRVLRCSAVAAVFLLISGQVIAGGPPRLCVPIDGVTPGNAAACAKLLADALADKLWPHVGRPRGVQIQDYANQSYATFYLRQDVSLSAIDAALDGSPFSVPRDRLGLFGHVILEIDTRTTPPEKLVTDLELMEHVSVDESNREQGILLVTVDMPYWRSFGEETFHRCDFSSDSSTRSEPPATARTLPSYSAMRDVLAKHKANLTDIRWSAHWGCRLLGCVVVVDKDAEGSKAIADRR